jgi:broad specificity phosphatase PhoE/ADP-ribose pyrophosphatase YjhB (NUDIX family)
MNNERKQLFRKGVSALIINNKNEFLLVNLESFKTHFFAIPGGGLYEKETLEEAVYREIKEELGIGKQSLELLGFCKEPIHFMFKTKFNRDGVEYDGSERYFFGFKFIGENSEIKFQEGEIRSYKWVSYDDLKDYLLFDNQLAETTEKILELFPYMNKKNILFVRHGESLSNAGLPTQSSRITPLSHKGIVQAEKLAKKIKVKPQLIIVSKFLRTQESAKPLISKYKDVKVEIWNMIHEFTYLDRRIHKNKTAEQRKKYAIAYWDRNDPFYKDGPLEESFYDLLVRSEKFLNKLNKRNEEKIVIFNHGYFLRSLIITKKLNKKVNKLTKQELIKLMTLFNGLYHTFRIENTQILTWKELK